MRLPYVNEIPYQSPHLLFSKFAQQPWSLLLESTVYHSNYGRYSYIAIDPFEIFEAKNTHLNPWDFLQQHLAKFKLNVLKDLPPFQGGMAGFFSYEMCHLLERVPKVKNNQIKFPEFAIGFYDLVIAFDHQQQKAWLISTGFPEVESALQLRRAQYRMQWLQQQIQSLENFQPFTNKIITRQNIKSNLTKEKYLKKIKKIKQYIVDGDVYQVNFSQCFSADLPHKLHPFELYCRLRKVNPSPFSCFLNLNEHFILSTSPERFLKVSDNQVETRPIKGTRQRSADPVVDKRYAEELKLSAKDCAENLMIVDLLRNDLAKVCEKHSIKVPQLYQLESYATVHHLVSVITGELDQDKNALDLLMAAFPGGSITGAPKIRAMEIISELEAQARGPYSGNFFFINHQGDMDSSITIRSLFINKNKLYFQVGGGIVADSDAELEYQETLVKASALIQALTSSSDESIYK